MNALEMLLGSDRVEKRQEKKVKIRRLSPKGKEPVVFTLQSIGWGRVAEIRKLGDERVPLHILLAGVVDLDFKNTALQEKYGAATPAELVEKLLLPGEIEDLAREIEKLSGYRTVTLEEIKKKSSPETLN